MIYEVQINVGLTETRVALLAGGRPVELIVHRPRAASRVGNIYLGRVARVVPAMQAALSIAASAATRNSARRRFGSTLALAK